MRCTNDSKCALVIPPLIFYMTTSTVAFTWQHVGMFLAFILRDNFKMHIVTILQKEEILVTFSIEMKIFMTNLILDSISCRFEERVESEAQKWAKNVEMPRHKKLEQGGQKSFLDVLGCHFCLPFLKASLCSLHHTDLL